MIISASRRTDIPSYYSQWFFNRLRDGYVYVVNPFNRKQASCITLNPESVDCFVFWTKDPEPMIPEISQLKDYNYYFQFTLTSYRKDVEASIRPKREILRSFKALSELIGKDRVIWRYDPIFISQYYSKQYHYEWFEKFMEELHGYTEKCIISFLDLYKKTERNMRHLDVIVPDDNDICHMAERFSDIGKRYGIPIDTCCEKIDLSEYGINKGRCIDGELISRITGRKIDAKKDNNQREECGCAKSIDIGRYDTCIHNCAYCYANADHLRARLNYKGHNPQSIQI